MFIMIKNTLEKYRKEVKQRQV